MLKPITIKEVQGYTATLLIKTFENNWTFAGFSLPVSKQCKTIEEMEEVHEKYYDRFIQNVPYSALDKVGLESYINGLDEFMKNKPIGREELNILWESNPANIRIKVQYIPDGKFRDHEKQEWVDCPMYRIMPFIQNKFSKHFAYNPDDPMLDSRPEFTPDGFSGRQLDVLEVDLKQYIKDLKVELTKDS